MLYHVLSLLLAVWLPQTSQYHIKHVTAAGLALDRSSNRNRVSVAASGFLMVNYALLLPKQEAISKINRCVTNTLKHNPPENKGWLFHFTDADGVPDRTAEVSTIDSAIFYAGLKRAAEIINDPELTARYQEVLSKVNVNFVKAGEFIGHGWYWRGNSPEFIPHVWDDYSEGVIIYRTFGIPYTPRKVEFHHPLFVYYYPLAFFHDEAIVGYLRKAVAYQKETYGRWGITACDGPSGYQDNRHDIVSPLAIRTSLPFIPEAEQYIKELGVDPETPAFEPRTGWKSTDRVGIDDLCCVAILAGTALTLPR
jgi:hypothetical protein